jgi:signal transduction histidine kinase/CheY-like chemotaxis protein
VDAARQTREVPQAARWFRLTADPLRDERGVCTGSVHILTEITERKALEEQLLQAQKLEAVGRLAGGIAHDFNNLLTVILGNASLLSSAVAPGSGERDLIQTIERAAWRAADLTRQLVGFARQTLLWLRPTNLNEAAVEVVRLLERTIDPRVSLDVRLADDLWTAQVDPGQMTQVLLNLCVNALDAMPLGGTLTLETANVERPPEQRGTTPPPGPCVRVRVHDTGVGIPPEVLPRVFEPFFTTKPPGQGTGLGLAMVHGIVQQHQGWVECRSAPGEGTTFDLYLPRSGATAPARARSSAHGGPEAVLLADDNDMLRSLAATFLRRHGFQVLPAEDGRQALDLFRRENAQIDLVLLDLTIPRLSGLETLAQLRRVSPGVRVLLAGGHADPAELPEGVLGFVAKPYTERDLVQAVRAALDAKVEVP